jgi:hypothetical protein
LVTGLLLRCWLDKGIVRWVVRLLERATPSLKNLYRRYNWITTKECASMHRMPAFLPRDGTW